MRFFDNNGDQKQLSPTNEWRSVAGYWVDAEGELFNFPDAIATNGGVLEIDNPKHKSLALFALNYAKQRREQMQNTLQLQIAQLDKVIASLK